MDHGEEGITLAEDGQKAPVTVVIFEGGREDSEIESDLVKVRHALLLDNLDKFLASSYIGEIFLFTNYPELAREAAGLGILTEINHQRPEGFAFGRELQRIIRPARQSTFFTWGGRERLS
jgi:hypothetical protein